MVMRRLAGSVCRVLSAFQPLKPPLGSHTCMFVHSGRYLERGSSRASFPCSTNIMIPTAATGLDMERRRQMLFERKPERVSMSE